MKIICLFNLKPNVELAAYLDWARNRDIPNVRSLGAVRSFSVSQIERRLRSESAAPYQFIEIIEVSSLADFQADAREEGFQRIAAVFGDFADNPLFMLARSIED